MKRNFLLLGILAMVIAGSSIVVAMLVSEAPSEALLSEERDIFAVDDAAFFGEDPPVKQHYRLLSIDGSADERLALIAHQDSRRYYRQGESLVDSQAVVSWILPDAVLLNYRGSYSLLWRNGVDDEGEQLQLQPLPWLGKLQVTEGEVPALIDLRRAEQATRIAADYRQRLYERPLSLVGAIDVRIDKTQTGERLVRLAPGSDVRAFDALGLAKGDELIGINGIRISDVDALSTLYEQLATMPHMAATLRRDGKTVVVLLSLEV